MKASRNVIARIAPRIAQLLVALAFGGPPPAQAQGAREILDASGPFLTAQALSADQFGRVDVFMDNDLVRFVPTAGTHRLGYEFGGVLDALRDADGSSIGASSLGAFRFRLDDSVETLVPFDGDGTTFVESGNDVALGPDGSIYLADLSGHVFRRDPGGAVSLMPIADAYQIAAGPDGSLWWTTQIDPIVRRLPPGGAPIVVYDGTAGSSTPVLSLVRDMAIDAEGNAWLADMTNQLVRVAPDGTAQVLLSSSGTGTGPPFAPGIVRAGPDGSLWVYGGDDRIVRIAPDGTVRIMLERAGDGAHSFSSPRDMAVDAAGNVWVSGHASHNVFHVASDGTLTLVIDSNGDGVTPLQRPTNVLPDGEGASTSATSRGASSTSPPRERSRYPWPPHTRAPASRSVRWPPGPAATSSSPVPTCRASTGYARPGRSSSSGRTSRRIR
jgi:sugar lactone lactonase YvrE